jgi:hypothetical protein
MACCCGHGPWHRCGGPGYWPGYGPGYYGPELARSPRRRHARAEELEDYLGELEDELAAVRAELEELRGSGSAQ